MTHGSHSDFKALAPRSKLYQGPYGRLFPDLPPWTPFDPSKPPDPGELLDELDRFDPDARYIKHLRKIADEMVERLGQLPADLADQAIENALEEDFGSTRIPAGYTYFGQFVDHDITFDTASMLERENDPNGLLNHRTPRLDLDNVYGSGPKGSPHLYVKPHHHTSGGRWEFVTDKVEVEDPATGDIIVTEFDDLPRNSDKTALIGDPRNDENSMVSQIQLAFLLSHNRLLQTAIQLEDLNPGQAESRPFDRARTTLRWLYQHIVWNDFIGRITDTEIHDCAFKKDEGDCPVPKKWKLGLNDVYRWKHQPYIPVEFSVAAYRLGHAMVRNSYQTNIHRGFGTFAPIFDNTDPDPDADPDDLRGFRPMKLKNVIQWDWFLEMGAGSPFPQMARKFKPVLSNALTALHEDAVGSLKNFLAFRNLLRGLRFALPSGTAVAKKLCIPADQIPDIDREHDSLWYYILKEAELADEQAEAAGEDELRGRLGPVGSIIVCATFSGLLKGDPASYYNVAPSWTPEDDDLLKHIREVDGVQLKEDPLDPEDWTLTSIIRLSGLPINAADILAKVP